MWLVWASMGLPACPAAWLLLCLPCKYCCRSTGDVMHTLRLPAGAVVLPAADCPQACSPPPPATLLAARTHRELFSIWYADLLKEPLEELLAVAPRPAAAERFFHQMMRDINGACQDPVDQVGALRRMGRAGVVPHGRTLAIGGCGRPNCGLQVQASPAQARTPLNTLLPPPPPPPPPGMLRTGRPPGP